MRTIICSIFFIILLQQVYSRDSSLCGECRTYFSRLIDRTLIEDIEMDKNLSEKLVKKFCAKLILHIGSHFEAKCFEHFSPITEGQAMLTPKFAFIDRACLSWC
ncbi:unnamed protein product, partial [Mesorhabditis belari]|uniref:Saposin B-type domain-containing protein n=1 Tax=Mesorhabditis belari TaxID=2138241 RepID=A0AAF3JAX8_9BILA